MDVINCQLQALLITCFIRVNLADLLGGLGNLNVNLDLDKVLGQFGGDGDDNTADDTFGLAGLFGGGEECVYRCPNGNYAMFSY